MTGTMASAVNVLDTATSVTDARSRRACSQARAMSCSTFSSPPATGGVDGDDSRGVMCTCNGQVPANASKFNDFEKLFLKHSLYPAIWGRGPKMSRVNFNRNRVKLSKLLGIRARLALLALILVAPLMLERARSLEDARAKQIAQAANEFSTFALHSDKAQQEVISSVETVLKSAAYIRVWAGGIGRSCDLLRASLPASLPW